jgi:D-beta-D-heptose 7-phosphate kinase/D-beta-D-heptose 1-phosphate adenosyltransferase
MAKKIIAISGGADPVHLGHVRMINDAAKYGNVVFILNSDDWLRRKKGYVFMPFEERAEILEAFKNVHKVISVDDSDGTVCEAIKEIKPDYFGNGGDRTSKNTPERALCEGLNIELVWGLGGEKIQSSSELVDSVTHNIIMQLKRW